MQMDSLLLTSKEFNTQEIIYFEDIEQILWRENDCRYYKKSVPQRLYTLYV
ncbi:hypothetical protein LSPH24S_10192 [Lysinibacillus sphaericus]